MLIPLNSCVTLFTVYETDSQDLEDWNMGIFHLLSRLLMPWANNTDDIMFTFFCGDLDLWHCLTRYYGSGQHHNPALAEESNKMVDM